LKLKVRFIFKPIALLGFAFLAVACARTQLPVASSADAERSGVSVEELAQGRQLYVARCSACHLPVQPTKFPANKWPDHVMQMRRRAHLDEREASLVTRYLVTMAERQTDRVSSTP
jgi:mono/diheme cytochrome c family protein